MKEVRTYKKEIPLFLRRGYAIADGWDIYEEFDTCLKIINKEIPGIEKIGIKSNSPIWIVDEYVSWRKYKNLPLDPTIEYTNNEPY